MTTYHDLDWNSLNAIKDHLYQRLASPINNALGRLAIAKHIEKTLETEVQLVYVERNLERAMNLIRAWSALIHVKSGGSIGPEQRRRVRSDDWPEWLMAYLRPQIGLQLNHQSDIYVHPETFFESLLLLWRTSAAIGALKHITTSDAKDETKSIWLRAIFEPPSTGPYTSLGGLADTLSAQVQVDTLIQMMVLQDLFKINDATLKIQNNKQTNEQALAVCLPVVPADLPLDEAEDHFTSVLDWEPASGAEGERESFFAQVIHELNGKSDTDTEIEDSPQPTAAELLAGPVDVGETETLLVPPPSLRERLAALDPVIPESAQTPHDKEPNGQIGPDKNNPPDTLIVPPPGFHERLAAFTNTGNEIEVVTPGEEGDTVIVPPPEMQRRLHERRAKRDSESMGVAESAESKDSAPPHRDSDQPHAREDDVPHETSER